MGFKLKHPGRNATAEELAEFYALSRKRIISRKEVEGVFSQTKSNREAADRLGVRPDELYRFASLYKDENGVSLWEKHKNRGGKGTSKGDKVDIPRKKKNGKYNFELAGQAKITFIHELNKGTFERWPPDRIKRRLFYLGIKEPKCDICGFSQQRVFDGRVPLTLLHKDGNRRNSNQDNLELRCYNCCFLYGGPQPVKQEQVDQMESRHQNSEVLAPDWELDPYQKKFIDEMFRVGPDSVDENIFEEDDGGNKNEEETSEMAGN